MATTTVCRHGLCSCHWPAPRAGGELGDFGPGELARSFSAADRDSSGAVDLAELTAALAGVPDAALAWWAERVGEGQIELMEPEGLSGGPVAPVVVPAAVVKLLPTVLTCLEETGVGVRYPAGPFTRVALAEMVRMLTRSAEGARPPELSGVEGPALSLQAAAAMDFMLVTPTGPLIAEISAAATALLGAEGELSPDDRERLTHVLGGTAFGKGVLAALSRQGPLKLRALLLDEAVCAAESATGDGTTLSLAGFGLREDDVVAIVTVLSAENSWIISLNLRSNLEDNQLGGAAGIALAGAVQSEHCRLTSLNLRGNDLGKASQAIQQALPAAEVDDPDDQDDY